jgi:16S rRNA (guanine527-N7)-methyltransferase
MPIPDVSRETEDRLRQYQALLLKWQKAVNLVSPSTLNHAWERHFLDSLQLLPLVPGNIKTAVDLGSGAGFPGMVMAVARPDLAITLIESDSKKCSFLKTVSRETNTRVDIINERIEAVLPISIDLITARALTSLQDLLSFSLPYAQLNNGVVMLFPKGKKADDEIKQAEAQYLFKLEIHPSQTDSEGRILLISHLSKKD